MSHDILKHLNDQFQTVFNAPEVDENKSVIKIYKGSPPKSAEDPVNEDDLLGEYVPLNLMNIDLSLQQDIPLSEFNEEHIERVATEICKIVEREVEKAMIS